MAVQLPLSVLIPSTGGQPLREDVRQRMEVAFGTRFHDVRIHVGTHAQNLGAHAFTQGHNVHFAVGRYDPTTALGQQLLAHELAHVVQQRAGRVQNPFGSGTAIVHDPMFEAEAERMARRAVAAPAAPPVQPMRHRAHVPPPRTADSTGRAGIEPAQPRRTTAELRGNIPRFVDGGDYCQPFHAGMRLSAAPYAAAYGVYHAADLASLGLLNDLSWYQGAVARGDMSVVRAGAGFAATAVTKGAAAYATGAFTALGTGVAAVATSTGLATRAGRWASDWVDWAAAGHNNPATDALNTVRGETTKTTGMVAIGAPGVRGNANTLMGQSASRAAGRWPKANARSKHHYEWLHLLGRSLGGMMVQANFVAGSFHANTEMIPLENAIRAAADAGAAMAVCITAFCVAGTDVANRINYKVYKNGAKVFEKNFDANRGPVSAAENAALHEAATAAIGGGWWGTVRRVVGPR
jgi:hypothetical protein